MSGTLGWLSYFGVIFALFYLIVLLAAPRKWLFSLLLLIYAIAMVFVADEIRAEYGSSNVVYAVLNASATVAASLVIMIPLVFGMIRLCLFPFVRDSAVRMRLSTLVYWFAAGFVLPFVVFEMRVFARYPGAVLMVTLLGTSVLAAAAFLPLRRRVSMGGIWFFLPGYALGAPMMLAACLYYGAKVIPAASAVAQGMPYCIESGPLPVTSMFDMTPLTLISREYSEYHGDLIVETIPKPQIYNWSWQTLSFSPVKPDMYFARTCAKQ